MLYQQFVKDSRKLFNRTSDYRAHEEDLFEFASLSFRLEVFWENRETILMLGGAKRHFSFFTSQHLVF